MVKIIEGKKKIQRCRIAVVVSRFNDFITENLLTGCVRELKKCGVKDNEITVVWVPGAFEIPLVAKRLAKKKSISAVICLGAVIRGETLHFDLVAHCCARGIAEVAREAGKPVIFEVLTTETLEQAYRRSTKKGNNKGREAALAAVEMIHVLRGI